MAEELIQKGDIVRFKEVKEAADDSLLFIVEEDNGDRVLVRALVNLPIQPTYIYSKEELSLVTK